MKQVCEYAKTTGDYIEVGHAARLLCASHPKVQSPTILTTAVLGILPSGVFETKNTIYIPV